ncbi:MAG: GNAT family N-acetyltransferase [Planctomycetota bacterium]|nr:GNAT family N-acetyltransferase [Planctomycetota bacterium]
MEIRPYQARDFDETLLLWHTVCEATYTYLPSHTLDEAEVYFRDVIVAGNVLHVATVDGRVIGLLALQADLLDRLYVAIDRQGEGVGSALLEHAREQSPTGLRLFTHQKNERACRFYERHGFTVARYGMSPPPESEPDVEYRWVPA